MNTSSDRGARLGGSIIEGYHVMQECLLPQPLFMLLLLLLLMVAVVAVHHEDFLGDRG